MLGSFSATIEIFDCDSQENIGPRWNKWLKRLNQLFVASATTDAAQKEATLFLLGGTRLSELHDTLPENVDEDEIKRSFKVKTITDYEKAMYRLTSYFNPKRNTAIEIFKVNQARQQENETIVQYVSRLRLLATYCNFTDEFRNSTTSNTIMFLHNIT